MNETSDSEQNSAGLLGDNGLEESEWIDPAHLEEWMEAIDAYKADAELRHHNEFCMFPFYHLVSANPMCHIDNQPLSDVDYQQIKMFDVLIQ